MKQVPIMEQKRYLKTMPTDSPLLKEIMNTGLFSRIIYRRKYYLQNGTENTTLEPSTASFWSDNSTETSNASVAPESTTHTISTTAKIFKITTDDYIVGTTTNVGSGETEETKPDEKVTKSTQTVVYQNQQLIPPKDKDEVLPPKKSNEKPERDKGNHITHQEYVGGIVSAAQGGVVVTLLLCILLFGVLCTRGIITTGPAMPQHTSAINPELLAVALQRRQAWEKTNIRKKTNHKIRSNGLKFPQHRQQPGRQKTVHKQETKLPKMQPHIRTISRNQDERFLSPCNSPRKKSGNDITKKSLPHNRAPKKQHGFFKLLDNALNKGEKQRQAVRRQAYATVTV